MLRGREHRKIAGSGRDGTKSKFQPCGTRKICTYAALYAGTEALGAIPYSGHDMVVDSRRRSAPSAHFLEVHKEPQGRHHVKVVSAVFHFRKCTTYFIVSRVSGKRFATRLAS